MRISCDKRDISLKELEHHLENMISLLFGYETMIIIKHIHYGSKLKQASAVTFTVADHNGCRQRYRLTITLDSLAGSEKTDAGMNTTGHTGGKDE